MYKGQLLKHFPVQTFCELPGRQFLQRQDGDMQHHTLLLRLLRQAGLLRLPGCYYLTNYFDTVAENWRDFDVVPMASNVQFIVFKSKNTGHYYIRIELNEKPVALRQGDPETIFPWGEVRRYLTNCIPLYRN